MKLNNLKLKIQKAKNIIVGNRHKAFGDEDEFTTSETSCRKPIKPKTVWNSTKCAEMQSLLEFQAFDMF